MSDLIPQIIDGTHTRANVNAVIGHLEECGARRVPIDPRLAQAISGVAAQLMDPKKSTPRMQAAGAKLVLAALKHNLEIVEIADRVDRLDSGRPTENMAVDTAANLRSDDDSRAKALEVARLMNAKHANTNANSIPDILP